MNSQIQIKKATFSDASEVIEIFIDSRSNMKYLPIVHTPSEISRFFTKLINDRNICIAKKDDAILGFMELKDGWLNHLYVKPKSQNSKIGTLLLLKAKELSSQGLCLWVFEENKNAIRFYEREGFVMDKKRDKKTAINEEKLPDRKYSWKGKY